MKNNFTHRTVSIVPHDGRRLTPLDDQGPVDEARGILTAAGWDPTAPVQLATIGLLPATTITETAKAIAEGDFDRDEVRGFVGSALRLGIRHGTIPRPADEASLSRRVYDSLRRRMTEEEAR